LLKLDKNKIKHINKNLFITIDYRKIMIKIYSIITNYFYEVNMATKAKGPVKGKKK
jgi:hypothetical protein